MNRTDKALQNFGLNPPDNWTEAVRKAGGLGYQDRLVALAESVNETARMARVNISLALIVALYLTLTLLTATDENLLRNSVVTLPQLETGISLEVSYLFSPIVFVYLHGQTLFLLVVLTRKVQRFESALVRASAGNMEFKEECRDWLSAVSIVQGLIGTGRFGHAARGLTWLAIAGLPLLLLFLIDLSFLRYQSAAISLIHHVVFCVDLAGLWIFWRHIVPPRPGRRSLSGKVRQQSHYGLANQVPTVAGIIVKLAAFGSSVFLVVFVWTYGWFVPYGSDNATQYFDNRLCPVFAWRGTCRTLSVRGATLTRYESGEHQTAGLSDQAGEFEVSLYQRFFGIDLERRVLRFSDLGGSYLKAARLTGSDLRDASLRGAHLRHASLVSADLEGADLRDVDLHEANLQRANLRVANLRDADLKVANLGHANLWFADLQRADLRGANLQRAQLERANLREANLGRDADANLWKGADLYRADLRGAEMQEANLRGVRLEYADLSGAFLDAADLGEADLRRARLRNADLRIANLESADLSGARLEGADLSGARLEGADLSGARLEGADLSGARLEGADLSGARLEGANLRGARQLDQDQLRLACGDQETRLSDGLAIPICTDR